jgi:hypothetical protein
VLRLENLEFSLLDHSPELPLKIFVQRWNQVKVVRVVLCREVLPRRRSDTEILQILVRQHLSRLVEGDSDSLIYGNVRSNHITLKYV